MQVIYQSCSEACFFILGELKRAVNIEKKTPPNETCLVDIQATYYIQQTTRSITIHFASCVWPDDKSNVYFIKSVHVSNGSEGKSCGYKLSPLLKVILSLSVCVIDQTRKNICIYLTNFIWTCVCVCV